MGRPKRKEEEKARTVRLKGQLESQVTKYLDKNELNFNKFINLAVEKFISEPQVIELEPVNTTEAKNKDWNKSVDKSFKKHRKAMDELS